MFQILIAFLISCLSISLHDGKFLRLVIFISLFFFLDFYRFCTFEIQLLNIDRLYHRVLIHSCNLFIQKTFVLFCGSRRLFRYSKSYLNQDDLQFAHLQITFHQLAKTHFPL